MRAPGLPPWPRIPDAPRSVFAGSRASWCSRSPGGWPDCPAASPREFGDTTVEAGTPVVALGLLLVFGMLYVVLRLIGGLLRLPRRAGRWRSARHRRLGDIAVTHALLALAAGEKGDARREASRARRLLGDTPQTLLLAAEAGRLAGRDDEADAAFRRLADRPGCGVPRLSRPAAPGDRARGLGRSGGAGAAGRGRAAGRGLAAARTRAAGGPLRQLDGRAWRWPTARRRAPRWQPRRPTAESDPGRALKLARQAWKDDPSLAPAALAYAGKLRVGWPRGTRPGSDPADLDAGAASGPGRVCAGAGHRQTGAGEGGAAAGARPIRPTRKAACCWRARRWRPG